MLALFVEERMLNKILQGFVTWWKEKEEENRFVYDTLSDLHQKLLVFDQQPNFWTIRGCRDITIYKCNGGKYPLHLYGKTTCLCVVTLEKRCEKWNFVLASGCFRDAAESRYSLEQVDVLVEVLKIKYGIV